MESVLLGLVLIVCIYILYCIFTPAKEGFTELSQSEENRLGAIAATINSPINWNRAGTNPTNLTATAANPDSYGTNQNTYNTALGNPNTGPRIDDTSSLLYMIDFCHQGAKMPNPFSDSKFATSCGVCMTQGSLINGTAGSNLGVVVYPEDKAYSIAQGIDAVPSARSATCAPIVKSATASSNVRSVAINADQYTTTKAYMQSNAYTIISGTGSGTKTFTCSGSSNGHNYVIKKGAYRDGVWDTHLAGAPVDYTRKNLLTTTPFDQSCTEKNSCTLTTSSMQWDASSLCGYPKPTPITSLGLDDAKTTPTSLTFIWTGGEFAESVTYSLVKDSDNSTIPGNKATLNLTGKFVTYTGLRPNTVYTFTLIVSNPAGKAEGSYTTGSVSGFTNFMEDFFNTVTGLVKGQTGDDRDKVSGLVVTNNGQTALTATWTGGKNALTITVSLSDSTNTVIQSIEKAPGATVCQFTNLVAGTTYGVMLSATYADGPSISISATGQTAPVPRIPMTGISVSGVTTTGFTVSWSGCDNATSIRLVLSGPGNPPTQTVSPTTKSFTYTGLQPGTTYTFYSVASYASGEPITSQSYTQRTVDAPRIPMSGVGFSGVSPTGFTVSWSGCDNATGITLILSGPGNPANQTVSPTTKHYTYTGLQSGSMYAFSSLVTYPSGDPITSQQYTQRTADAPVQISTPPPVTATPPPAATPPPIQAATPPPATPPPAGTPPNQAEGLPTDQPTNITAVQLSGDIETGGRVKVTWTKLSSPSVMYMIYVNRSQTSGDTRSLPVVMGSRAPNPLLVPDPSNPNRLTYIMNTSDEKRNVGFSPSYITVIAVDNFSKKYSLPASIFVPITINIQSLPGAQPTNVKVVKIHQNMYKNNWQLQFGNAKASWIPPPGVVQYAFIYDANPPGSGKNTVAKSTVKLFKPSETSVDPNYPNEIMYITHNFYYPPAVSYAGIVALYDDKPLDDQFYSIPESSYVLLNAHDNGPAYSGPPVKLFKSCEGLNEEDKDEMKDHGVFKPGNYFYTQHFYDNIGYVYVPGGLIAEFTDGNGYTVKIEGGSEYYGKGVSLCRNLMVLSVKNSGIVVNPPQGQAPRQALTAEEVFSKKYYIDNKPFPPGIQPYYLTLTVNDIDSDGNTSVRLTSKYLKPYPVAYIVIGSVTNSPALLSKVKITKLEFLASSVDYAFVQQKFYAGNHLTFTHSEPAWKYKYMGIVAIYDNSNSDYTIPSKMFVENTAYESELAKKEANEKEAAASAIDHYTIPLGSKWDSGTKYPTNLYAIWDNVNSVILVGFTLPTANLVKVSVASVATPSEDYIIDDKVKSNIYGEQPLDLTMGGKAIPYANVNEGLAFKPKFQSDNVTPLPYVVVLSEVRQMEQKYMDPSRPAGYYGHPNMGFTTSVKFLKVKRASERQIARYSARLRR